MAAQEYAAAGIRMNTEMLYAAKNQLAGDDPVQIQETCRAYIARIPPSDWHGERSGAGGFVAMPRHGLLSH